MAQLLQNRVRTDTNESTCLLGAGANRPCYKNRRGGVSWAISTLSLTYEILKASHVNILLVFVPMGIIAGALEWNSTAVFFLNFLAIIPLGPLLAFATEQLVSSLGQTIGALLEAILGNAVEWIVSTITLDHK
jgi:Ca2+:H+ antiporter